MTSFQDGDNFKVTGHEAPGVTFPFSTIEFIATAPKDEARMVGTGLAALVRDPDTMTGLDRLAGVQEIHVVLCAVMSEAVVRDWRKLLDIAKQHEPANEEVAQFERGLVGMELVISDTKERNEKAMAARAAAAAMQQRHLQ